MAESSPQFVYELSIAAQAKPFPYGPVATAMWINSHSDGRNPISIKTLPAALHEPAKSSTSTKLVRKSDGVSFSGMVGIALEIARAYRFIPRHEEDKLEWPLLKYLEKLYNSQDKEGCILALDGINVAMVFAMHPLGVEFTVGDLLLWGAIKGSPQLTADVLSGKWREIERWYKQYMEQLPFATRVIEFVKEFTSKSKGKAVAPKTAGFKLEGAEMGKVVTRFPPEPSGYLHIGHAKAAILNATAAADYEGRLIIRFDDTNPSKEKAEFEESQLADLKTLGISPDIVSYTSNYFGKIEEQCIELIKKGLAYCDDTDVATMRQQRMDGIASKCRDRLPDDSLRIFQEMKMYTEYGKNFCVRAKISVDNRNKALRDPVIYRCNNATHHRTGDQYKIYPTYDFACPVVDSMEGVTHALRTLEYKDRDAQYAWMLKSLGMRPVRVVGFSRLNFVRTVLSKRKLQWFVDQGFVTGWDDPRFPTVRGVMRRGCVIEALRKFIISQGPSKNINNLEWASFWAENKKVIDPVAKRFTCISAKQRVVVTLVHGDGVPQIPEIKEVPSHKKNPDLGNKSVYYSNEILVEQEDARTFKKGEEITLMDWGNAIIQEIIVDPAEGSVTSIKADLNLKGDFKKTEKKITWIANVLESLTPCTLTTFDHLITKDKLEENDKIEDFVNRDSVSYIEALGDVNLRTLPVGSIIQFERKGYYRLDTAYDVENGRPGEFFLIPDGKTVNRYGAKA